MYRSDRPHGLVFSAGLKRRRFLLRNRSRFAETARHLPFDVRQDAAATCLLPPLAEGAHHVGLLGDVGRLGVTLTVEDALDARARMAGREWSARTDREVEEDHCLDAVCLPAVAVQDAAEPATSRPLTSMS